MKSRHCPTCAEWWPAFHFKCPVCNEPTEESSKAPMTEEEYKWLLYTKKGRISSMPKKEEEQAQAEWDALEAEAARRGERWSVADLLEEGWSSVRPAA